MHFLISVADIFNSFLFFSFFFSQSEEPLIHFLYDQLTTFLKMLMGRFIRKELLANKPAKELSKSTWKSLKTIWHTKNWELVNKPAEKLESFQKKNKGSLSWEPDLFS